MMDGEISADVTYICGVTLEPYDSPLKETIEARFSPHATEKDGYNTHETDDVVIEPLEGATLDVGAIAIEFLTLGLSLYPRKLDADFGEKTFGADISPFAALAKLKTPPSP
jgi:uncharacterized metal-binding protein YceD (DUF177 family)